MTEIEEENNTSVKELKSQCEKVRGNKHPLYDEAWADYADRNGITYDPDDEKSCRSYLNSYEKWYHAEPEKQNENNNSGGGSGQQENGDSGQQEGGSSGQSENGNQNNEGENQSNNSDNSEANSQQQENNKNNNAQSVENSENTSNEHQNNHLENQNNNNNQQENSEANNKNRTDYDSRGKFASQRVETQENTEEDIKIEKKQENTSTEIKYCKVEGGKIMPVELTPIGDVHKKVEHLHEKVSDLADLRERTPLSNNQTQEIKETPQDDKINTLRGITPSRQEQQQTNKPREISQEVMLAYKEKKLLEPRH